MKPLKSIKKIVRKSATPKPTPEIQHSEKDLLDFLGLQDRMSETKKEIEQWTVGYSIALKNEPVIIRPAYLQVPTHILELLPKELYTDKKSLLEDLHATAKRLLTEDLTKDSGLASTDAQFQNSMESLEKALTST